MTLKKEKLKKDAASEKDRLYSQVKETLSKLVGEEPQGEITKLHEHLLIIFNII